jgi:hypothetical protein
VSEAAPRDPDYPARRRLRIALAASVLFHLSAVTIFKIVVYFPIQEVRYYELKFVETPAMAAAEAVPEAVPAELLERWERLPRLEPPRLAETDYQLSLSGAGLEVETLYERVYGEKQQPPGPLAEIGAGLRNLQTTFGRLSLEEDRLPFEQADAGEARQDFTPVSGFTGVIVWPGRDAPRPLMFSPPLQSLWNVDTRALERGLEFQLSVSADGRVTRVWHDALGEASIAAVEAQLMQYRFEPETDGPGIGDTATVVIREADEEGGR